MSELEEVTKTLHQLKLDIAQSRGLPHIPDAYSTLNEIYKIGLTTPPSSGYPELKYIMMGNGGIRLDVGLNNSPVKKTLKHKPTDAALYNAVPFVMIPINEDLPPSVRNKYRLRVLEVVKGVSYFSYYAKVIENLTPSITVKIVEYDKGAVIATNDYIPSPESLSPTPILLSNITLNTLNNRDLVVMSLDEVILRKSDIDNLKEAITIKYGVDDIEKFTISEMAVVQGWTEEITSNLENVSATFNEIKCGQVASFIVLMQNLLYGPSEWVLEVGLSNSTPMAPNL